KPGTLWAFCTTSPGLVAGALLRGWLEGGAGQKSGSPRPPAQHRRHRRGLATRAAPAPGVAAQSCCLGPVGAQEEPATRHPFWALGNQPPQHRGLPDDSCLWGAGSRPHTAPPHDSPSSTGVPRAGQGMNREGAPGKSPEEMYIQQKVRVLLMLRKMGSNLTASEEEFLRTYAGVVNSQLSQLPQHSIDQGESRATAPAPRFSGIASCGSFRS
uniref:Beta-catenin-interacting protein 1 n=3 Tax=Laurasiatheria TaxID=314145 RepID=A0A8D1XFD6_PIG